MKQLQKIIPVALVILVATHSLVQAQTYDSTLLVGTWHVDFQATVDLMSDAQRVQYDSLDATSQQQMEAQLNGQYFTFTEDQRFEASTTSTSYPGAWQLETTGQLVLTYDQGAAFRQKIEQLDSQTLVLQVVEDPNSEALFHHLHLTKTN